MVARASSASVTEGTGGTTECSRGVPGGPGRELSPGVALCGLASDDTATELTHLFPAPGPSLVAGSFETTVLLMSPA